MVPVISMIKQLPHIRPQSLSKCFHSKCFLFLISIMYIDFSLLIIINLHTVLSSSDSPFPHLSVLLSSLVWYGKVNFCPITNITRVLSLSIGQLISYITRSNFTPGIHFFLGGQKDNLVKHYTYSIKMIPHETIPEERFQILKSLNAQYKDKTSISTSLAFPTED